MEARYLQRVAAGLVVAFLFVATPTLAGELSATAAEEGGASTQAVPDGELARRNRNVLIGGELLVGWYGATHWWSDGLTGNFRTTSEGWFGRDTYAGGADKMGHLFFGYAGTRLLARGFEGLGNTPDDALRLGAAATFGTLVAIEVVDGFSKKWRFSYEDAIMNAAGTALGVFFERSPRLDGLLDFRLMYRPARSFDPVGDYSGQTYLLVAKAAGVPALNRSGVRYLELAVGYGSRGFDAPSPAQRQRLAYFGISLNLSEILNDTLFREDRGSRAARTSRTALEFFQVPGTAAALATHSF